MNGRINVETPQSVIKRSNDLGLPKYFSARKPTKIAGNSAAPPKNVFMKRSSLKSVEYIEIAKYTTDETTLK